MNKHWDDSLKAKLESIENMPLPDIQRDSNRTWNRIEQQLTPKSKMISIQWLYAAASIALLFLFVGGFMIKSYYNTQTTMYQSQRDSLMQIVKYSKEVPKIITDTEKSKPTVRTQIKTVIETKYITRTIIDTVFIEKSTETSELIALNTKVSDQPLVNDTVAKEKSIKKVFLIADEMEAEIVQNSKFYFLIGRNSLSNN